TVWENRMYLANSGWPSSSNLLMRLIAFSSSRLKPSSVTNSQNSLPQGFKIFANIIPKEEMSFIHGFEEFLLLPATKVLRIAFRMIDTVLHRLINLEPSIEQIEYRLLLGRTPL